MWDRRDSAPGLTWGTEPARRASPVGPTALIVAAATVDAQALRR